MYDAWKTTEPDTSAPAPTDKEPDAPRSGPREPVAVDMTGMRDGDIDF